MDTSPASAISLESGVGPVLAKFQDVQRIAVLRGLIPDPHVEVAAHPAEVEAERLLAEIKAETH